MLLLSVALALPAYAFDPVPSTVVEGTYRPLYGDRASFVGDLDGDGYDDLIVSRYTALELYHGSPSGPGVVPDLELFDVALLRELTGIGDVNGDGYDDMAHAYAEVFGGPMTVAVRYGSGLGVSANPDLVLAGGATFGMALAHGDFDEDGYDDLVVGDSDQGTIEVYFGGAGGLETSPGASVTRYGMGTTVAVGDVDGDGHLDILGSFDDETDARVYQGDGAGGFPSSLQVFGSRDNNGDSRVALVDFDGDGVHSPVISSNEEVQSFLGPWPFLDATLLSYRSPVYDVYWDVSDIAEPGDVDGDGLDDLVIEASMARVVLFGSSTNVPSVVSAPSVFQGSFPFPYYYGSLGDVDGDGQLDLLESSPWLPDAGAWLYPAPTFPEPVPTRSWTPMGVSDSLGGKLSAVGDVNGDGYDDVASRCGLPVEVDFQQCLYMGSAAGLSPTPAIELPGGSAVGGDVDGDGLADVLELRDDGFALHLGRPTGLLAAPDQVIPLPSSLTVRGFDLDRDLNGDGRADLVVLGVQSSEEILAVALGGAGGLGRVRILWRSGEARYLVGTADVNGDGFLDAVVEDPTGTALAWLAGTGPGTLGPPQPIGLPPMRPLRAGDFNGDGYDDVVLGDGTVVPGSAAGPDVAHTLTLSGAARWVGDLDGDGYDDLVIGDAYALDNDGVAAVHRGGPAGLSAAVDQGFDGVDRERLGAAAAAADVDGDGLLELVLGAPGWNADAGRILVFEP